MLRAFLPARQIRPAAARSQPSPLSVVLLASPPRRFRRRAAAAASVRPAAVARPAWRVRRQDWPDRRPGCVAIIIMTVSCPPPRWRRRLGRGGGALRGRCWLLRVGALAGKRAARTRLRRPGPARRRERRQYMWHGESDGAAGGHVPESDAALQRDPTPSIPAGAARRSPAHAGIPSRCIRAHAASPAPAAVVRPRRKAAASGGAPVVRTTQWRRWPRPSAPAPSGRRRPAEPASLSRGPRRCGRRLAGRRPFGGGWGGGQARSRHG